ncbi:MAG: helix-turn-helix domain-containing protein [Olsenella sp.]|jgi:transcriptional regulator with XRE-family HTH domain|nr:helix-turn-helix domain-containing protein [Olsenella sp.]
MYEIADRLVGKVLRKLRMESGLKQNQVADRLGTSQSMISKFESGERSLHLGEVYAYAEALGTSPQRILREVWESRNPPHGN